MKHKKQSPFSVVGMFRDQNMPNWNVDAATLELAKGETWSLSHRIAGLKSITIRDHAKNEQHVFTPGLDYLFTLPLHI